jgi:hypothetical protein
MRPARPVAMLVPGAAEVVEDHDAFFPNNAPPAAARLEVDVVETLREQADVEARIGLERLERGICHDVPSGSLARAISFIWADGDTQATS